MLCVRMESNYGGRVPLGSAEYAIADIQKPSDFFLLVIALHAEAG